MKKLGTKTAIIALITLYSGSLFAQDAETIHIKGDHFVQPIVEKWITEYKKENAASSVNIKVNQEAENVQLSIVASQPSEENSQAIGERIIYVGKYALIPISNTDNPLLEKASKGLKKKELANLIFEKDILDDEYDADKKEKYTATFYSRGGQASTTLTLADYFDQSPERIKGKKIIGDEIYLLNAIKKDVSGITFNTLNYVYDLKSRQLKADITILPLNIKDKHKEVLGANDIDKTIALLEESKIETIPVGNFGIRIPAEYVGNENVLSFVNWILAQGQKFNHEYGFLNLDNNSLADQKEQLNSKEVFYSKK
ncbi:MAG: substrate-binding domain-containing protein [Tannerella sp.]|jgi:ABC-type phosphate transport system substrate-binding protein|nr:substrate-binding domain-containing protein [Tannerella sp.]